MLRVVPLAVLLWSTHCLAAQTRSVEAGEKWEVTERTRLSSLTIAKGAQFVSPDGRSLTMTVNNVEESIEPGTYNGDIVLTPSTAIYKTYSGEGITATYEFRTAVYVNNGSYMESYSVPSAAKGGAVDARSADGVNVTSAAPLFSAFLIDGNSAFTINRPVIHMTGNGKNDFFGYGASIRVGDKSQVTINGAKIDNSGAVRTAIWVGDNANVTVNDSEIEAHEGVVPKDYGWSWATGESRKGAVLMEAPWMLGVKGNNRATVVVGHGTATYNNTHIRAQAWGALATDSVEEILIKLNKCHIETVDSGYGAIADENSMIDSRGSTFDVADYGAILIGGSVVLSDGSVLNSRRFGLMAWGGNTGRIIIDKGSVVNSVKAAIQLKSASPEVLIDNATVISKSGTILEMFPNDDPNQSSGRQTSPPDAKGIPRSESRAPKKYCPSNGTNDQFTTIKNTTLTGNFVNALTETSAMNVSLINATVTGAITTASYEHAVGPLGEKLVMQDSPDLYYLIGEVTETYAPTLTAHGASVTLDGQSKWIITQTSYLTGLTVAPGASIAAPAGHSLGMTVDGTPHFAEPGVYKGEIVLTVSDGK